MKKIKLITLLIFTGISVNSFAQIEYLKGFIVKGTDTTHCFIKKEPLKTLQYNITVKNSVESSEEKNYTPSDLNGFYIESFGHFVSKQFKLRYVNDIMKSTDYMAEEEEKYIKEKAFIKTLNSGPANLYSFLDKDSKNHYFIEKDTIFYELYEKFNFKMVEENNLNKRKLFIQRNFQGKLAFIFNDCPKIKSKIKSVKLSESNLIKITKLYNKCMGYESEEDVEVKKLIIEKSVCAGLSLNNFFFWSDHRDVFVNSIQPYNQTPTGGFNFNFIFPRISYDFSLYTGLLYSNNKFIANYDTVKSDISYIYKVDLNTHFIKAPLLFKYTLNKYKIKPYVFAGGFAGFVVKSSNEIVTHAFGEFRDDIDSSYVFEIYHGSDYKYHPAIRKFEIGYTIGLGVKTKLFKNISIFIESRYETGSGISKLTGFGVKSKYYSFITGIEF
ncbi:MAG: PorT family protein [Bacteroidales bacterium]|nr:PorT family protein [Bacteroidales bacterium]